METLISWPTLGQTVGNTPLVVLPTLCMDGGPTLLAKLEYANPSGSAKDRIAVAMIDDAEERGLLASGGTIVEPTSGNTGAALAMIAAQRGYRCILVVPPKTSSEKIRTMQVYGAKVIVAYDVDVSNEQHYTKLAARIARETPGAYMPNQYANPVNAWAHEQTTAVEIWEQTRGAVTHVIAGIGSGGTICGVSRGLKARDKSIVIVGVDPVGSVYAGGKPAPYEIEGIGRHYFPPLLDLAMIDTIETVNDVDAFAMTRVIARTEGLFVGGSSGAVLVAAQRLCARLKASDLVVAIMPDSGKGYFSKIFDDEWLSSRSR